MNYRDSPTLQESVYRKSNLHRQTSYPSSTSTPQSLPTINFHPSRTGTHTFRNNSPDSSAVSKSTRIWWTASSLLHCAETFVPVLFATRSTTSAPRKWRKLEKGDRVGGDLYIVERVLGSICWGGWGWWCRIPRECMTWTETFGRVVGLVAISARCSGRQWRVWREGGNAYYWFGGFGRSVGGQRSHGHERWWWWWLRIINAKSRNMRWCGQIGELIANYMARVNCNWGCWFNTLRWGTKTSRMTLKVGLLKFAICYELNGLLLLELNCSVRPWKRPNRREQRYNHAVDHLQLLNLIERETTIQSYTSTSHPNHHHSTSNSSHHQ